MRYIRHRKFAQNPGMYIRGFLLLQKDLGNLFEYIEPVDANLECYSFRVYELLLRACTEVEANCKAILRENGYTRTRNLNMDDYRKAEESHRLSGFEVRLPVWRGHNEIRAPFKPWSTGEPLPWYQAYNQTKHDRSEAFKNATFEHAIDAICGVLAVLSAQFTDQGFSLTQGYMKESVEHGFERAIGKYFVVRYPVWPDDERYEFTPGEWEEIRKAQDDPFQNFPYSLP